MGIISRSGGGLAARDQLLETGLGVVAQPYPQLVGGVQVALTSGTIYCVAVGCRGGDVHTNMLTDVTTAGAGTTPTLIRQGVADSTGKILAVTADSHASAVWTSAAMSAVALSAPLTIPSDGLYYLCIIEVGAFGTTPMQLRRAANPAVIGTVAGFPRPMAAQTGQADLPAVNSSITLAGSNAEPLYLAAS